MVTLDAAQNLTRLFDSNRAFNYFIVIVSYQRIHVFDTPNEALPKVKTAFGLNYVKEARDVVG
jgi:hypothetical protein